MTPPQDQSLSGIIEAYLAAVDTGSPPPADAILEQHPQYRDDLVEFFADQAKVRQRLATVQSVSSHPHSETPTHVLSHTEAVPSITGRFGDYMIEREIAHGGMGVVFLASQIGVQRRVALKVLAGGATATAEDRLRFRQEIDAIAELEHPNIVPIFEVGEEQGIPFFSMKYIEGGSLAQFLACDAYTRLGKDRFDVAASLLACVSRAVHYAHLHGILHRDLKPGNILLSGQGSAISGEAGTGHHPLSTRDYVPFVTDFGLAKRMDSDQGMTQSGAVVGTPSYMAPEQALGHKQLTTSADVYSLGAILFHLLTGKRPFQGDTPLATLLQVQACEPVDPRSFDPSLPHDLAVICLKCLEKQPSSRYGSALLLAEDLERWLTGEPISARAASGFERLSKWARRRPAVAALAAGMIGITIVAVALVTWQWRIAVAQRESAILARQEADARADAEIKARQRADYLVYVHQVARAEGDVSANDLAGARNMLDRCPEALRGWEWNYVRRLSEDCEATLQGLVQAMAVTPTRRLITTSKSTTIWDFPSLDHPASVEGKALGVSPDGSSLAVWTGNGIDVWSVADVKKRFSIPTDADEAYFCDQGRQIATWNVGKIEVRDSRTGHKLRTLNLEFPPQYMVAGNYLAGAAGTKIRIINLVEGRTTDRDAARTIKKIEMRKDGEFVAAILDDHRALVFSPEDQAARPIVLDGHEKPIQRVFFDSQGKFLATSSEDGTTRIWDYTGKCLATRRENALMVLFRPDGKTAVSWSAQGLRASPVYLWDAATGTNLKTLHCHDNFFNGALWSPEGRYLVTWGMELRIWDFESPTVLPHHDAPLRVAFHPLQPLAATSNRDSVFLWDHNLHRCAQFKIQPEDDDHMTLVTGLAFHPHRPLLAAVDSRQVYFWETEKHVLHSKLPGQGLVVFDPKSERMAALADQHKVRVWDRAPNDDFRDLPARTGRITSLGLVESILAVGDSEGFVSVWQAARAENLWETRGHDGEVLAVSLSPDGQTLASAGKDGRVRFWDTPSGKAKGSIEANTPVCALAFSPDGSRLAVGSRDTQVKLYNTDNLLETFALRGHTSFHGTTSIVSLAFSADGALLASVGGDQSVRLWNAATCKRLKVP